VLKIIKNKITSNINVDEIIGLNKNMNLITFLNSYSYLKLRKEKGLLNKFDHIFIDGIVMVILLNIFRISRCKRVSFDMTSLAPLVFDYAQKKKKTIYFVGTEPRLIDSAIKNIRIYYPDLNISGYRNGFFKNAQEKEDTLQLIRNSSPDIVIAGMGTPLQEKFLIDLQNKGWEGVGFTCGGFLEQSADNVHFYPVIINKLHLRWLYRIYKYPIRIGKRVLIDYPLFLIVFFLEYLSSTLSNNKG